MQLPQKKLQHLKQALAKKTNHRAAIHGRIRGDTTKYGKYSRVQGGPLRVPSTRCVITCKTVQPLYKTSGFDTPSLPGSHPGGEIWQI
jgi:hypothetical protein